MTRSWLRNCTTSARPLLRRTPGERPGAARTCTDSGYRRGFVTAQPQGAWLPEPGPLAARDQRRTASSGTAGYTDPHRLPNPKDYLWLLAVASKNPRPKASQATSFGTLRACAPP